MCSAASSVDCPVAWIYDPLVPHYNFMVVGHTKFVVDGCFGTAKKRLRKCNVYSKKDVIEQFPESDEIKSTMHITAKKEPKWLDFKSFVRTKFGSKPLNGILKYQQFLVKKRMIDGEEKIVITGRALPNVDFVSLAVLESKNNDAMPTELPPAGISAACKKELNTFFPMYENTPFVQVVASLRVV